MSNPQTPRKPRTPEQAARNRAAIAARVAERARAAGREPGRRGRPPRKCGGCGLALPKGKGGKCIACGAGPDYASKKKEKKTCAGKGRAQVHVVSNNQPKSK